jgi:hypothetical protein
VNVHGSQVGGRINKLILPFEQETYGRKEKLVGTLRDLIVRHVTSIFYRFFLSSFLFNHRSISQPH